MLQTSTATHQSLQEFLGLRVSSIYQALSDAQALKVVHLGKGIAYSLHQRLMVDRAALEVELSVLATFLLQKMDNRY